MQTDPAQRDIAADGTGRVQPDGASSERRMNTVQLRAAMRSARTPSTTSAREPSAASFDTDDEAAGRPAQAAAIELALAQEGRLPAQTSEAGARAGLPGSVWIIAALLVAVVLLWLIVL
jgi:hypothetical protein